MGERTTIIQFEYEMEEFWDILRLWCLENNFEIKEKEANKKLFHKNIKVSNWWLLASHDGNLARIEAWGGGRVHSVLEPQLALDHSFIGSAVKRPYRVILNKLLDVFEQVRI